ncbi:unnamed protein product [Mytilus coruscus]|uniref:Reverse transcriptase/retrotransposon-derived protein RNase H-like domain-containing protein n=1 Tax=Mytilus coruscus TaxID=42192 RepID=A0A6J8F084_MYTCO|nr:unnamed protein product [Mytilus coruscus]
MLKLYVERDPTNMCIRSPEHKVSFVATVSVIDLKNEDTDGVDIYESELIETTAAVANETLRDVHINKALTANEIVKVQCLLDQFSHVLSDIPGRTNVLQHVIKLTSDDSVRFKPYPIPYTMFETLTKGVDKMIEMNIIERSDSSYSSPFVIVIVKKKDQTRPSKCYIAYNSLEVLGHIVGTDRLSPNPDKIEVIKNAHSPTTKKQVRRFTGMAEFYRKFVPNFLDIASPLTDVTKKRQPNQVRWEDIHEKAFPSLKNALVQAPCFKVAKLFTGVHSSNRCF